MTRFINIFYESDTSYHGPIRSARPTDPTVLRPLGGVLVASGATGGLISENQKDLDKKIKKLSTYTNIPEDYYHERPLIGTKDKVFTTLNQYKEAGCEYLIAYIPDIVWGDTVDILSELN